MRGYRIRTVVAEISSGFGSDRESVSVRVKDARGMWSFICIPESEYRSLGINIGSPIMISVENPED